METVLSKNGIMIRLTAERWSHITEEHCELAGMKLEKSKRFQSCRSNKRLIKEK